MSWILPAAALDSLKKEIGGEGRSFRTDYRAVLQDGDIDAVHIALPTPFHYTVARAALEAGKHVLLEKPMASSSREAFKLASLAEERGPRPPGRAHIQVQQRAADGEEDA